MNQALELFEDLRLAMVADMIERAIVKGVEAEVVLSFGQNMARNAKLGEAIKDALWAWDCE